MHIYEIFATFGSQLNDFNQNLTKAIQKVNNLATNMANAMNAIDQSSSNLSNSSTNVRGFIDDASLAISTLSGLNGVIDLFKRTIKSKDEIIGALSYAYTGLGTKLTALTTLIAAKTKAVYASVAALTAKKAVLKALGIGLVIAAVSALVTVFAYLGKALYTSRRKAREQAEALEEVKTANDKLIGSVNDLSQTLQDNAIDRMIASRNEIRSIEEQTETQQNLLSTIAELSALEEKTPYQRERIAQAVDELNHSMEGLNLQYDKETGLLDQSVGSIQKQIEMREKQGRAAAAQERLNSITEDQLKIYDKLNNEVYEHKNIMKQLAEELSPEKYEELNEEKERLNELIDYLTKRYEVLGYQYDFVSEKMEGYIEAIEKADAAAEAMEKARNYALARLAKEYTDLKNAARDMFNTLSNESETSTADMVANLQNNQKVMSEWAEDMDTLSALAGEGLYSGLIEHFRNMGVSGAAYVRALVDGCRDELHKLGRYFEEGARVSAETLAKVWGLDKEVAQSAADLGKGAALSLVDALEHADFNNIGRSIADAIANAVAGGTADVVQACEGMAEKCATGFRAVLQISSPSRVFYKMGEGVSQGFLNGMEKMAEALPKVTNLGTQLTQIAGEAVNNLRQNIISTAQSLPSDMMQIGQSIVDGVWNGIQNAASQFTSSIQGFFGNIVGNVKGALGINSPSRVFAEIGRDICRGFVEGIDSMDSAVKSAMDDVFGKFEHELDVISKTRLPAAASRRRDESHKNKQPIQITFNQEWHVYDEIDLDMINRKQAQRLQDVMRGSGFAEI